MKAVAMASRKINVYDTRKLDPKSAELETETLLKFQTRSGPSATAKPSPLRSPQLTTTEYPSRPCPSLSLFPS